MPVPKKRKSPARRDRRRAHHDKVAAPPLSYCPNPQCGAPVLPHHVCPECGQYRGDAVIEVVSDEDIEARKKAREEQRKAARAEAVAGAKGKKGGKPAKSEADDDEADDDDDKK